MQKREKELVKLNTHHLALSLQLSKECLTCGKSGLSSLDFLMQSATNLFMALGQFL